MQEELQTFDAAQFCQHDWFDLKDQPLKGFIVFYCRMCLTFKKIGVSKIWAA